jgi:octaprenyl-diphosphate synthase
VNSLARLNQSYADPEQIKTRIYARIRPDLERIEAEIDRHLTSSVPLIGVVGRYIMGSGGKRLRPLLMILSARLCGYQGNQDVPLAVVFEYIHAASLLHDDVVDKAEFRRNNPAANTLWGNPAVVLVGDFLYAKSFLMTIGYNSIKILRVLSETTTRMAEGEVLQHIHADNLEIDEEEYLEVINRKTAVLISAACQVGGILGGVGEAQEEALRLYGHHLGIAFQLTDDALDFTGKLEELGKPIGNDVQEGKATLPLIHTMHHSSPEERDQLREIFSADKILPKDFERLQGIVLRSGGIDRTIRLAVDHVQQAKDVLGVFPDCPTREVMLDIADYVIHRRI